ncbi:MAG TPA: hypothetical protein PK037_15610, partial [Saprospiraceae bacterium]|nr:hypothetical protein [Saprospiraceae bacterium]
SEEKKDVESRTKQSFNLGRAIKIIAVVLADCLKFRLKFFYDYALLQFGQFAEEKAYPIQKRRWLSL